MLIKNLVNIYFIINLVKSTLKPGKNDKYDSIMDKRDNDIENQKEETPPKDSNSPYLKAIQKQDKLDQQVEALKKVLKEKNLYPITSNDLWAKIYKYIMDHIDEFLKNLQFSISFPIRYTFCVYIIPIIPAEKTLVFPAFYKFIIPRKVKKIPLVKDWMKKFDDFMNIIKKKSKTELLVTVRIKRPNTVKEDLEILKRIPDLVKNDPMQLIRWIFEFKAETTQFNVIDEVQKANTK